MSESNDHDGRLRVLLVDDDPQVRRALRRVLEGQFVVDEADGSDAALRVVRSGKRFDVLLTDVNMPGSSGIDLVFALVAEKNELADRAILMTGGSPESARKACPDVPVIEKPILAHELVAAILAAAKG